MQNAKYFRPETPLTCKDLWKETYAGIVSHVSASLCRANDASIAVHMIPPDSKPPPARRESQTPATSFFHLVVNGQLRETGSASVDDGQLQFVQPDMLPEFCQRVCADLPQFMGIPRPPPMSPIRGISDIPGRLRSVQRYLDQLGYNHLGYTFFQVKKTSSLRRLHQLAREMINEASIR
ncbi:MAG: hypothetical protein SGCHY_002105 [Lobulomycetales sp.]